MELDFEIDKITESIENAETGESLNTLVLPVTQADLKETTKKYGWIFDCRTERSRGRACTDMAERVRTSKGLPFIGNRSFPNLNIKCINWLPNKNRKLYRD